MHTVVRTHSSVVAVSNSGHRATTAECVARASTASVRRRIAQRTAVGTIAFISVGALIPVRFRMLRLRTIIQFTGPFSSSPDPCISLVRRRRRQRCDLRYQCTGLFNAFCRSSFSTLVYWVYSVLLLGIF